MAMWINEPLKGRNVAPGSKAGMTSTGLAGLICAVLTSQASAYSPSTNLGSLGLNENQQRSGDAVQIVCGQFARGDIQAANDLQQDLFDQCRSMVHNGNEISGSGPTRDSLGLNQQDLMNSVMTVANEELAATKSMATEMPAGQTNAAVTRLAAVRQGVRVSATGFALDETESMAAAGSDSPRGGAAGDGTDGDWGFFVNIDGGTGERDRTANENQFDYDTLGFDVGFDYQYNPNVVAGFVVSYQSAEVDFSSIQTAANVPSLPGGKIDADSYGVGVYGTYYKENYYVDGLIGYSRSDYEMNRRVFLFDTNTGAPSADRLARADTNSDSFTVGAGAGMDLQKDNITYGPYGRLTYQKTDIDGYTETGAAGLNLTVGGQDWESLTSVIGGRVGASFSKEWGVVVPQARLGWIHEFMNDSQQFSAFYANDPGRNSLIAITDNPDRDYFELGLGVSAVMQSGLQMFFDYQTLLGHSYLEDHLFTVGLRRDLQ